MKLRTLNATITGFTTSDNGLTVYFTCGDRKLRSLAHPALRVQPHINKAQEIKVLETEQGWKMIQPYPTKDELATWEQLKAEREAQQAQISEATKAQLKLLTF